MRRLRAPVWTGAFFLLLSASAAGATAPWPGESRGPILALGAGYGSGRILYPDLVDGARFASGARGGTALDLHLTWPLASRVDVGFALDAWFGAVADNRSIFGTPYDSNDDWSLSCLGATVAWRPVGGLFLRGGLGRASAAVTFSDFEGFEQILRDHGLGWRVGAGYELGLARDFALVPSVEWRGFELGVDNRARVLALSLAAAFAL